MDGEGILGLVLRDQLSGGLVCLSNLDPARDVVLMAEVHDEATSRLHRCACPLCPPP